MANRKPLVFVGGEIAQLPDGDTSTPSGAAGGVLSGEFPNPGFAEPMATQSSLAAHTGNSANPHNTTKAQVGLGNVDNTSDANKPVSAAQAAANTAVATAAAADATAKANAAQAAAIAASTPVAHATNTSNPHSTTKAQVGLGNVDNTSDANKPVSTAQANANAAVAAAAASDATAKANAAQAASTPVAHATNTVNPHSTTKAQVGLGNVDNTSDVNKPVSTAQAAADVAATNAAKTYTDGLISSGIKFPNGSIAAPGIAFSGDPDTGFRNVSQGVVSLVLNGFDRVVASAAETEFRGYVRSVTANGGAITGNRDASPSWFLGDLKEATGSGSGMVNWVYGNNPYAVYINGGERFKVDLGGATITGSASATRFLNGAPMGLNEANARNHFKQYNAGTATITTGWIAAAFGDETGNRVVAGQAGGVAILAGHTGSLSAWSALVFGGEQFSWTSNGLGSGNLMTLDSSANLSINGDLKLPNQKYFSSGSFGRFWGNAALAVGQAQFAGLYGPTITYNAKIVGGAWQSIGGGTATAMTMDEGIFSVSQSQPVGADGVPLTWTTSMLVTPSKAEFKGLVHADGGGVGWAPGGYQGAVLGRVGNDAYVTTHYDVSSLTLGAGVTQKNGIKIYGHTYPGGDKIVFLLGGTNMMEIQPAQARVFTRLVASGAVGNQYNQAPIEINGGTTTATKPTLGFHQPGFYAGTLRMDDNVQFGFYQIDGTSLADLVLRNLSSAALKTGRVTMPLVIKDTNDANYGNDIYIPYDGGGSTQRSFRIRSSYNNALAGQLRFEVSTNGAAQYTDPALLSYAGVLTLAADGSVLIGATTTAIGNTGGFAFSPGVGSYGGALSIGHSTSNVNGSGFLNFLMNGTAIGSIAQSGSTAVTYNTTSDWRLKTNVRPSDAKRFMEIEFVDFEWTNGRHDCGVIAHQLQAIYPDLVTGKKDAVEIREIEIEPAVVEERLVSEAVPTVYDGDQIVSMGKDAVYETVVVTPAVTEMKEFPVYQQVNYQGLIGRMGTVIQQQHRALEAMTARVDELEKLVARIEALENKLNG